MGDVSYGKEDAVVSQYDRWAYPPPVADLTDPSIADYLASFKTMGNMFPAYWPAGQPREDLDILVAGCGTMAAACFAYLYPKCRVLGIDFSETALQHEQRLKQHHKLENLALRQCAVEQTAELGMEFDYVSCHGVLHHLPDPSAGLKALAKVVRRQGIIGIMLYAKYARQSVYVFQDLFRLIGLEQTPQDVAIIRQSFGALSPDHPLRMYLSRATDLNSDAGLVDTFLHRRDQAYTVAQCLALVREAALVFQGWDRNYFYHPEGLFAAAPGFCQKLKGLPQEQVWEAVEMAFGLLGKHSFFVCRADRDPQTYVLPWNQERLLECIPLRAVQTQLLGRNTGAAQQFAIGHPLGPPIPLTERQARIIGQIDGRRTSRQCLAAAGITGDTQALIDTATDALGLLWRMGLGLLQLPAA